MKTFTGLILIMPILASATLLDKIAAVIDKKSITISEINRVQKNYKARMMIAPLIYKQGKNNKKDIVKTMIQTHIVRKKLKELGMVVEDSLVNQRIEDIRKSQGVSNQFLYNYLGKQGISEKEYFILMKEMIEISYFNQKIIAPNISIKDSEVDEKYSEIKGKMPRHMIYNVTTYTFPPAIQKKYSNSQLLKVLKDFRNNPSSLPADLQGLEGTDLPLRSADINRDVYSLLSRTRANRFSKPKVFGQNLNIFFMRSKEVDGKMKAPKIDKNLVKQEVAMSKSASEITKWIEANKDDTYIKSFL